MAGTDPRVSLGVIAWEDTDTDSFIFNWQAMPKSNGQLFDYATRAHYVLGTNGDDAIVLKGAVPLTVQGGGGDDTILTGVNTKRDMVYGDWEKAAAKSPDPANRGEAGDDIAHLGNNDWFIGGGGADTAVWHPNPGGYTAPGVTWAFNPNQGDAQVFAHDEGFTLRWVAGSRVDATHFRIDWLDIIGQSDDPLLDGMWLRLKMGDGTNALPFTIAADHGESLRDATRDWLDAHDGEQHPLSNDAFMF
jgi:hypothetical protein